jgi:DNA-binding MarR family transcriptional regulator
MQLASALRISIMRLGRRLRNERTDETLSLTQLSALATILADGPLALNALAELEQVQPASLTRVINTLREHGLVERIPHATDLRVSVIAITPAGRQLMNDDRRRRSAWLVGAFKELHPEERAILEAASPILERLSAH